jgi:multiple sugar transport system substrate-binding protein
VKRMAFLVILLAFAIALVSAAPVKLRIIYPGTSEVERQWSLDLTKRVKEVYPNYELEFIYLVWADMEPKIVSMMQAQDYPDMLMVQDIANLVSMDALEPLDGYLNKGANPIQTSSFIPSTLQYSTLNGKLYAMPISAIAYGLLVNETLLNSAGMKLSDLKTWPDFLKAAKLMTKGDQYGYAIAAGVGRFVFRDGLIVSASDGFNPSMVDKEKQYKEMLQLYHDVAPYMPKAQVTWDYPLMFRAYCDGRIGMLAQGTYFSANVYPINPQIIGQTRAVAFPVGPSLTKTQSLVSNGAFAIIKQGKNKEAALNVLKVIYEKELSAKIAAAVNITSRTDISADVVGSFAKAVYPTAIIGHTRVLDDFGKVAATTGIAMPKILGQTQMETVFQKYLLGIFSGDTTVDDGFKSLQTEIGKIKAQF